MLKLIRKQVMLIFTFSNFVLVGAKRPIELVFRSKLKEFNTKESERKVKGIKISTVFIQFRTKDEL